MTTLKHYTIRYCINGRAEALNMEGFEPPTLDQARLRVLLKHIPELQIAEDAPWETPTRPSLASRTDELGLIDIRIEPA